jgi:hypothetical protein
MPGLRLILKSNGNRASADCTALGTPRETVAGSTFVQVGGHRLGRFMNGRHNTGMKKGDVICPECNAGFRRIELASRHGSVGEFHCPLCDHVLEVFDGSTEIAYRLTVAPEKLFE